jgi:hypothetical protein
MRGAQSSTMFEPPWAFVLRYCPAERPPRGEAARWSGPRSGRTQCRCYTVIQLPFSYLKDTLTFAR